MVLSKANVLLSSMIVRPTKDKHFCLAPENVILCFFLSSPQCALPVCLPHAITFIFTRHGHRVGRSLPQPKWSMPGDAAPPPCFGAGGLIQLHACFHDIIGRQRKSIRRTRIFRTEEMLNLFPAPPVAFRLLWANLSLAREPPRQ